MNKIEKLLKELCPNGVEYKKLNEVCDIVKGKQLNKDKLFKEGPYAVINGGINPSGYWEEYNFNEDTITISQGGASAGYVQWQENKFWAGAHCYVLINPNSKLIYRFIYHVVKMNENKYMESQLGAGIPSLSSKDLGNTEIPIPPLEIQKEIVNVLDKMVFLERELERELDKRKTQYSYYRDKLLSTEVSAEIIELGALCDLSAGGDVPKNEYSKEKNDEFFVPIYSNGIGDNALYGYTRKAKILKKSVTISARGTIGYAALRTEPYFPVVRLISATPKEKCTAEYLYHYLQTVKYNVPSTGIPQLTIPMIEKTKIKVPSLEIQQKIVDVLDNFEKYCSDLNIGLPAEIEARRKQYEYYRNKLLSFNLDVSDVPETLAGGVMKMLNYVFGKYYVKYKLKNVCNRICSGGTPNTSNKNYYGGEIPWLRTQEVDFNGITDTGVKITQLGLENSSAKWVNKNAVIVAMYGATVGKVAYTKIPLTTNQACCNLEIDEEKAYYKYVFHYLSSKYEFIKSQGQGSQTNINADIVKNIEIPLPPIDVQRRTVEILDVFDAYVNDLTDGLPAEIDGRRKQYEFYRNKLLTFNRLGGE